MAQWVSRDMSDAPPPRANLKKSDIVLYNFYQIETYKCIWGLNNTKFDLFFNIVMLIYHVDFNGMQATI